jgi:NAD-dependent deacetylase
MEKSKKKLVAFTGAGISAESGINTFRDSGGLWEGHDVMEVASQEGWKRNPLLVQGFYNQRRKQLLDCQPNEAHEILAELEQHFDVTIITQNVDDLHERAGSTAIIHLHGELSKAQSSIDSNLVYKLSTWEIKEGDLCEMGSQLRPHIVWFGEQVAMMDDAIKVTEHADIFLVIGTSLQVYPAAGLLNHVPASSNIYLIDPSNPTMDVERKITFFKNAATVGMRNFKTLIQKES